MARGFLSGLIWGGVVSVVGAGVVSVLADGPTAPDIVVEAPQGAIAPAAGETSTADAVTDADLVRDGEANQAASPSADDVSAATAAGSDTPTVPETGEAGGLDGPTQEATSGGVAIVNEAPVLPSPQASLPSAPNAEDELSISTDPAQPPAPTVPETETAFEGDATDTDVADAPIQPQAPAASEIEEAAEVEATPDVADGAPDAPQAAPEAAETTPDLADVTPEAAEVAPEAADATGDGAQVTSESEEATPDVADVAQDVPDIAPATPSVPEPPQEDIVAALPSALDPTPSATDGPTIGRQATSLVDRTPEVAQDAAPEEEEATDLPPIQAYAIPFENADDRPLMAIVLIDSGVDLTGGPVGLAALQSFPYPLSFAVDASLPDAGKRMSEYRAQGFEVMTLIDLPQGATAGDTEVTLSAALSVAPEAVAVMEGVGTGVQGSRDASDQITEALIASGHGLVLQSKGLNTAQKLALREGVPTGLIFRDFDSAGQTPSVIRRFLDQAAFRAGQEGGVIMVGRVRPDTISALLLWGLQDRAERVALAPISAVLMALAADP